MPLNRFLHPAHIRWAVRISEYIRIQKACPNIRISEYTNTVRALLLIQFPPPSLTRATYGDLIDGVGR